MVMLSLSTVTKRTTLYNSKMERKTEEITHIDDTCIFGSAIWSNKAANGEAWVAVLLTIFHVVAPCHWHVVNNPGGKKKRKR